VTEGGDGDGGMEDMGKAWRIERSHGKNHRV